MSRVFSDLTFEQRLGIAGPEYLFVSGSNAYYYGGAYMGSVPGVAGRVYTVGLWGSTDTRTFIDEGEAQAAAVQLAGAGITTARQAAAFWDTVTPLGTNTTAPLVFDQGLPTWAKWGLIGAGVLVVVAVLGAR